MSRLKSTSSVPEFADELFELPNVVKVAQVAASAATNITSMSLRFN